jgi:hypothetical protein
VLCYVRTQLLEAAGAAPASEADVEQAPFSYSARGYVTNANYSTKRPVFVLFINHRLVDSTRYTSYSTIHTRFVLSFTRSADQLHMHISAAETHRKLVTRLVSACKKFQHVWCHSVCSSSGSNVFATGTVTAAHILMLVTATPAHIHVAAASGAQWRVCTVAYCLRAHTLSSI